MADDDIGGVASPVPLFDDVFFTVISNTELPDVDRRKIIEALEDGGARYQAPNLADGRIADLTKLTHIVSITHDFPEYDDAIACFKHVVRPAWIDQCIEKNKQTNPRQFSPDPNLIFSDIVIACADIPEGDQEAIAGGVLAMGGSYSGAMTKLTTHLLALSIDDDRCQVALRKNLKCKILLPHWFDDCLRLGKRISEAPYLLPDPEILVQHEQPPAPCISDEIKGAESAHPEDFFPSPTDTSSGRTRQLLVFKNKAFMLAEDLSLPASIEKTIKDLIVAGKGRIVEDPDETDAYICRYRQGADYVLASQEGKDVGNLAWLYHLITYNAWTSPMRRLLHYPVPKDGVPGFKNLVISVSNYTGETRLYLENLVKACGGNFTKTMRQDNTHLITAHTYGEKCDAAREWNVEVVNHLWLEESYAQHKSANLSIKRYTHFPPRTHLGEVVGRTQFDRKLLESKFFPRSKAEVSTPKPAQNEKTKSAKRTAPVPQSSDEEEEEEQELEAPNALQELENDGMDVDEASPTTLRKPKRNHGDTALQTPALRKFIGVGKENETPGSTGSRGAKARAMSKLHDAAADIALYDKERKRVGGVTHGGRGSSAATPEASTAKKRKTPEAEEDTESEEEHSELVIRKAKRTKSEKLPPVQRRMVLTGYQRWVDNPKLEQSEKNQLRNLGILITEDTSNVDLLCAPKIVRTKKFVCALADSPEVVTPSFLDHCLRHKEVPDPAKHRLHDRATEESLGIKLSNSLDQAKINKHHLLTGWQIFCTEGVTGGFETFKAIVEANGGTCMLYKGRVQMNVSKRSFAASDVAAESQGNDKGDTLHLISGNSKQETALWPKFRQMAESADMVPVVVKTDWLLSVSMQHVIHWDDKWEWK